MSTSYKHTFPKTEDNVEHGEKWRQLENVKQWTHLVLVCVWTDMKKMITFRTCKATKTMYRNQNHVGTWNIINADSWDSPIQRLEDNELRTRHWGQRIEDNEYIHLLKTSPMGSPKGVDARQHFWAWTRLAPSSSSSSSSLWWGWPTYYHYNNRNIMHIIIK